MKWTDNKRELRNRAISMTWFSLSLSLSLSLYIYIYIYTTGKKFGDHPALKKHTLKWGIFVFFKGHPLLVHQFVTVSRDFKPVPYCQPSSPTPTEYATSAVFGMVCFDHHRAEITVMQFTGPPLPVHQFVTVSRDFKPVPYCQPSLPTPTEYATSAIFGMACLAGSEVNIQHLNKSKTK